MCPRFKWGGGQGGYEKLYVLYTQLNVDNFGQPLNSLYPVPICSSYFITSMQI